MLTQTADAPSIEDSYVLLLNHHGICIQHFLRPDLVGQSPWDWSTEADRSACREACVRACMERVLNVYEGDFGLTGQSFRCRLRLAPIEEGELVICNYHVIFTTVLTRRQREVLALIGGGADAKMAAEVLGLTVSAIHNHTSAIRRLLGIRTDGGMALAARQYGGNESETTETGVTPEDCG